MLVLIVVVGTFLSNRIRWVANDDADVLPVQFRKASVVFTERRAEDTALPIVGKRICQIITLFGWYTLGERSTPIQTHVRIGPNIRLTNRFVRTFQTEHYAELDHCWLCTRQ